MSEKTQKQQDQRPLRIPGCTQTNMPVNSSNTSPPECLALRGSVLIIGAFSITNILLILPLSALVLYLGYRRRRQRHPPTAGTSNSNTFTYQMAVMEMLGVLGCLLYCVGGGSNLPQLLTFGLYVFFSTWCVKIHFHTLTCVERYLAVVHPFTYLGLKSRGRMKIRIVGAAAVWLLCFMEAVLVSQNLLSISINIYFVFVFLAFSIICFCSISVLVALRRPRPGEASQDGEPVDPMRQRAITTVVTIMASLWLCLGGMLAVLVKSRLLSDSDACALQASALWFSLPSSLVLPLLYLHREGKLPRCRLT